MTEKIKPNVYRMDRDTYNAEPQEPDECDKLIMEHFVEQGALLMKSLMEHGTIGERVKLEVMFKIAGMILTPFKAQSDQIFNKFLEYLEENAESYREHLKQAQAKGLLPT